MKIERYVCDKCRQESNGNLDGWFAVGAREQAVVVERMTETPALNSKHACGEPCALIMVAVGMRELLVEVPLA